MKSVLFWMAVLIGIFLIVVYYRGSTSVIQSGGSAIGNLVLFLQGRNTSGNVANYPQ